MTIKRRLYISNILMLVIPVILSFIMVTSMEYVFLQKSSDDNKKLLGDATQRINALVDKWTQKLDLKQMEADADSFNEQNRKKRMSVSIYQGKELIYPSSQIVSPSIVDFALSYSGNMLTLDNTVFYRKSAGDYNVVLTINNFNNNENESHKKYHDSLRNIVIVVFLITSVIILLTNRILTQFVFRSIIKPLDILVYGVHQIRDGNLSYNIKYSGKDEFEGICSDFNEMAQRLLNSVNVRQKDEANRKELIAGISHDLRTPLTSIKAYVEGIEKGVASTPETQKRYLDTIKNKTADLEHIVNQLFLFSKLDIGEFPFYLEKINIGEELSNMMANISEEYEKKGLKLSLIENVHDIYVQADIVQLRNAIFNVMENSVKYKNKEHGEMKIICTADDKNVTVTLADNGPGVSGNALDKLFDIFYRSDPSRCNPSKGSGIGLSITAKILEGLGGSVRAENVPEGGLAIVINLPRLKRNTGVESDEKDSNN